MKSLCFKRTILLSEHFIKLCLIIQKKILKTACKDSITILSSWIACFPSWIQRTLQDKQYYFPLWNRRNWDTNAKWLDKTPTYLGLTPGFSEYQSIAQATNQHCFQLPGSMFWAWQHNCMYFVCKIISFLVFFFSWGKKNRYVQFVF